MLEEKNSFEIEALQVNSVEGTTFEIKDFDNVKNNAIAICNSFKTTVIQDDNANKEAKDFRAKCNKAKSQIKDLRLATQKIVLGKFEEQSKELEKIFDEKQKEIGVEVNAYAESKKTEKTLVKTTKKSLKLTFDYSEKLLQKIIDFCTKNSIEVEEI